MVKCSNGLFLSILTVSKCFNNINNDIFACLLAFFHLRLKNYSGVYLYICSYCLRLPDYYLTSLLTIFGVTALNKFHHGRRYTQTLSVMYAAKTGSLRVIKRSTL